MGNTTKRLLSFLLAFVMIIGLMNANVLQAFATEETSAEVASYNGVGYTSLEEALGAAEAAFQNTQAKQVVTLTGNLVAENIVVPSGVVLDCNSKEVTVNNLLAYGSIVNTGNGGKLHISGVYSVPDAGSAMPVYSSEEGYTLYSYTSKSLGMKENGSTVVFGYAPKFSDVAAYDRIIQGGKLGVIFRLEWTGCKEALEFACSDELMAKYGQMARNYFNAPVNVAMQLSVVGMETLYNGTVVTVTPILTNELGAQVAGEPMRYVVTNGVEAPIFENNYDATLWDVSGLGDGYVTVIGGGGATDKPLLFAGQYQNVDLTLNARDYVDSSSASRTEFGFEFDVDGDGVIDTAKGDQTTSFGIADGNKVQSRSLTLFGWKNFYDLSQAEKDQLTITAEEVAAGNEDGLDLRVIRKGATMYLFVEGKQVAICDLTRGLNGSTTAESGITADTKMFVYLRHYDDKRTDGVKIPFSISTDVETVEIATQAENGTVSTGTVNHYVDNVRTATTSDVHFLGEKITLTVTPNDNYKIAGITLDGTDVLGQTVAVDNITKAYSFVATKASYEAAATFAEYKVFEDNYDTALWDLSGQNKGYVTVIGGGGATDKPLQFAGQYQNVDLTLNARDYADSSSASRTEFGFEFDVDGDGVIDTAKGDQTVTFGVAQGDRVQTRGGTILSWKTPHDLTTAEKAQLVIDADELAAGNEDGLDLRLIRYGTTMYIFVEGKQVAICDLTKCANANGDTESGITADTKMFIYLRHYDDKRTDGVKIPFSISTDVETVEIAAQAENGTVSTVSTVNHYINNGRTTTTSDIHFQGEKITLTVTPDADYKVAGLTLDGTDVFDRVTNAGKGVMTYSFVAEKASYEAAATFEGFKVFENNFDTALWDISGRYDGYVTVIGGGGATNKPLQFAGQYQNVDLTLNARDYADSTTASRTEFGFEFDVDGDGAIDTSKGDQTVTFGVSEGNKVQTRGGTILNWKAPYDLTTADKAQLVIDADELAAGEEDGLDLRLIRYGTTMYIFVEGKQVAICDLTKCANAAGDTESGITADTKMFIYLRHYDDLRADGVKIPFSISTDVEPVEIAAQAENGTVSTASTVNHYINNGRTGTTSDTHFQGEKVTLTVTPAQAEYVVNKLLVNGADVTADIVANADGSYTYGLTVSENAYTVKADINVPAIFKDNYDTALWDISGQYDGLVVLPNGGGASAKPLEFAKQYSDIDLALTVRDYPNGDNKDDARTDVEFVFDNGETVTFGVVKTSDSYRIQTRGGTLLSWKTPYFIEDQALIDAYVVTEEELSSGDLGGLNFRIVRLGTEFYLYLNDTMVKGYDFSYKIAEDTPVTVYLRHYDDAGFRVEIPFTVTDDVTVSERRLFADKEPVTDYAYSFAVLPDTQVMVQNDVTKDEANLAKMIDWLVANKDSKKIQQVLGLGDITENNNEAEWTLAKEQFAKLDAAGISYSLVRGNHDQSWYRKDEGAENYTTDDYTGYMGTDAYRAQFDGFYSEDNIANSWKAVQIGDVKYLLLTLDYGAKDAVLNWASDIIYQHPDHNVIITTHAYLFRDGSTLDAGDNVPPSTSGGTNNGDDMWDKLVSKHENIVLVMSGHDPYENIVVNRSAGDNGNTVTAMLIDAQDVEAQEGSMGMVAMLYFSADGKNVQVEYYSTAKEKYFIGSNQFSLELDTVIEAGSSTVPATGAYTNTALTEGSAYTTTIADEQKVTLSETPYTISAWINLSTGVKDAAGVIIGNYSGSYANCLNIEISTNGNPRLYHRNANNVYDSLVFNNVDIRSDTQWVHLVFTVSGNRVSCYVNGELKQTLTAANTIQLESTNEDYVIGGDFRSGNARAFKGRILELDLYSGVLSAEKIMRLYENGTEAVTEGKIEY